MEAMGLSLKENPLYWCRDIKKNLPNYIFSDFKSECGEVADVLSFQREFLGRTTLSDRQKECYLAAWSQKGGEWNTRYQEIILAVDLNGGKKFWCSGDIAYLCYFISCLKDPHKYFTKITKRPIAYTKERMFDVVIISPVNNKYSRRLLFGQVSSLLMSAIDPKTRESWFFKYANLDPEKKRNYSKYEINFPSLSLGVGNIRIINFSGNPAGPEGLHILRYYRNELLLKKTKSTKSRALKMYEYGIDNTTASFPNRVGKVICCGSPLGTKVDLDVNLLNNDSNNSSIFLMNTTNSEFNPLFRTDQKNT